ncbi:hypothetical protein COV05_04125 [Candidatus Uhrbacteria bacterium CG10_big_fil_rev_8_21_14_0_10_48_16]|uniref:Uncharacterized protein n=1 Tax=Candidatus Uhrbacteria bacterium CG10_big_fil_rev_8_21_14_0_10_48_16 TaxID=1975038 RepID=A0A2M8LGG2_9BACT|nr:MAG: hypothetical protein COV05_04125 [Candidatus Uhrbacteria bacterium CG10_big_fil_rev_8_21_14_0_10_48_16]
MEDTVLILHSPGKAQRRFRTTILDGDRSLGLFLKEEGRLQGFLEINASTPVSALAHLVRRWAKAHDISRWFTTKMITMVEEEFETLTELQKHGPDISLGWFGSDTDRRPPEIYETIH